MTLFINSLFNFAQCFQNDPIAIHQLLGEAKDCIVEVLEKSEEFVSILVRFISRTLVSRRTPS